MQRRDSMRMVIRPTRNLVKSPARALRESSSFQGTFASDKLHNINVHKGQTEMTLFGTKVSEGSTQRFLIRIALGLVAAAVLLTTGANAQGPPNRQARVPKPRVI